MGYDQRFTFTARDLNPGALAKIIVAAADACVYGDITEQVGYARDPFLAESAIKAALSRAEPSPRVQAIGIAHAFHGGINSDVLGAALDRLIASGVVVEDGDGYILRERASPAS